MWADRILKTNSEKTILKVVKQTRHLSNWKLMSGEIHGAFHFIVELWHWEEVAQLLADGRALHDLKQKKILWKGANLWIPALTAQPGARRYFLQTTLTVFQWPPPLKLEKGGMLWGKTRWAVKPRSQCPKVTPRGKRFPWPHPHNCHREPSY